MGVAGYPYMSITQGLYGKTRNIQGLCNAFMGETVHVEIPKT